MRQAHQKPHWRHQLPGGNDDGEGKRCERRRVSHFAPLPDSTVRMVIAPIAKSSASDMFFA
jgi:hypothetical protein